MTRHKQSKQPKTRTPAPAASTLPPWYARRETWWLALVVLLAVTWLVYLRGLTGGWLLDDYGNIVNNDALKLPRLAWAPLWQAMWSFNAGPLGRPLSLAGFALERYFFGLDTYAFKATNLGMHLLATVLLVGFTRALLRAWRRRHAPGLSLARCDWAAFAIGAAWALHPFNLEPVLYAVQRETIQATLFTLGGLWAYVAMRERLASTWPNLVAIALVLAVFTFLGALSKETGVLLPLFTFLIEALVLRFVEPDDTRRHRYRLWLFYVVVLLIPTIAGLWWMLPGVFSPGAYATRDFTLGERVLTQGRVVIYYLRMVIAPWLPAMSLYHDGFTISTGLLKPATTLPAYALIAALLALAVWLRKRLPLFALGIFWFFAAQILESTVWPLEIAYEHRVYLADWGIILAVAALTLLRTRSWKTRDLVAGAAALAIVALALSTAWRANIWHSNLSLARVEARTHPHSPRATYLLSRIYTNLALDGQTRYVQDAYAASEKAAQVHGAGLDPWVAMVLLAAQTGGDVRPEWFDGMIQAVGERPFTVSDVNALEALVGCVTRKQCTMPHGDLERLFAAIDASPHLSSTGMNYANVLVTEANYIGYDTPTQRLRSGPLLLKAANVERGIAQYQENVFNIALADNNLALAKRMLARIERLNKLGKLDLTIAGMQQRLTTAETSSAPGADSHAPAPATTAPQGSSGQPQPQA